MAARLTAAELNPLVGVAVPPSAVADRVGREVDAPLPCAVLRCQELEDDGRNGFMSKRFGGGGVGGMFGGQLKGICVMFV
jgi:hypothetical protein